MAQFLSDGLTLLTIGATHRLTDLADQIKKRANSAFITVLEIAGMAILFYFILFSLFIVLFPLLILLKSVSFVLQITYPTAKRTPITTEEQIHNPRQPSGPHSPPREHLDTPNPPRQHLDIPSPSRQHARPSGPPPPPPPPPPTGVKGGDAIKGKLGASRSLQSLQKLKCFCWLKFSRAIQGSLWDVEEDTKETAFDMTELARLFSLSLSSVASKSGRSSTPAPKNDKICLINPIRAVNCGIVLKSIKMSLSDLLNAILALDDSVLSEDQVLNLLKYTPTKEEIEILKGFNGDKERLGECERYFLEIMKVPRFESMLRVFSFKIQFRSQVSDLRKNLSIVNSCAAAIKESKKLKRIMHSILSLGNALNQGTAGGSAAGFRLESLLKLSDTRACNNKITLLHYLCKVLAEKRPELMDFHKEIVGLDEAAKMSLKSVEEEMQYINKGIENVVQELSASEKDGPVSDTFRKTLKEFLSVADAEAQTLTSLYSDLGKNGDALSRYFGEDTAKCSLEQVGSILSSFVGMFIKSHEENGKQIELEKKKALKASSSRK